MQYFLRYVGRICGDVKKVTYFTLVISRVTGQNIIIFAKNVDTIFPFNILKVELTIIRSKTPVCQMRLVCQFALKLVDTMQRPLTDRKEGQINL